MNTSIQKVKDFVAAWKGRGYEKGETQTFWLQFLRDVSGTKKPEASISFEMQVDGGFIDAYLPDSRVIIEQKSASVKLDDSVFQQAKRYNDALNFSRKARWIITCNFQEFLIYDMDKSKPQTEPVRILLEELPDEFDAFKFLVKLRRELDIDRDLNFNAGKAIEKLYNTVKKHYDEPESAETFHSLNKLCVRLVFCLYADNAGIFPEQKMFQDYLLKFNDSKFSFRSALIELFKILDTPPDKRSKYLSDDLKNFPYVDGGLFHDEQFDFPDFKTDARDIFFNELCNLRWAKIDPTIFGAVFESVLNLHDTGKKARQEHGIHYTTPENIQKVIKPLFMDDLYAKFHAANSRRDLFELQDELARIKIFDPACGSGNFLTESYLLLRELENSILEVLVADGVKFKENPIKVSIENLYGVEINGFAAAVARTALWISEIQRRQKTNEILKSDIEHFPLSTKPNITCANALQIDWRSVAQQVDYIISNPPFVGKSFQSKEQKADMEKIFAGVKGYGNLDYVACWYKKAADFIQGTKIRCAFVSTNSICQGIAVPPLWKYLFERKIHVDFAYRTFKWESESDRKAHVHVVIIGFSAAPNPKPKIIFDGDKKIFAQNINGYLLDAPNIFIESRSKPLCDVPEMINGSTPVDNGNLIVEAEQYDDFVKAGAKKFLRPYIGSEEFINGKQRYCLWLKDFPPNELRKIPLVMARIKAVKEFRLASRKEQTRRRAETPTLFSENRNVDASAIIVPMLSSCYRRYVPIGFIDDKTIVSNLASFIPNADNYIFGVITSKVCMAWMRAVGGRLKSDYRFSATIVYNTFPFPSPTPKQKAAICLTAQKILDVRAKFPKASLADLYDELTMPQELRKAHRENDAAVMKAYNFAQDLTEAEIVAQLMEKYLLLTKAT